MSGSIKERQDQAHRLSVEYSTQDVAGVLLEQLGRKLTAHVSGVADPGAVTGWTKGRKPHPDAEERLRATLQVFTLLQAEENSHVARAWLIGMNPQLDDGAPADALREGRYRDVLAAARAYLAGG